MKNLIKPIVIIALLMMPVGTAFAQKKTKQDCTDPMIKSTAENLKNGYIKQGMSLYQEAMLDMTSMEPMPIAVRLYEGVEYQLVFVGAEHSNKLIFQLFDGKDNKLDEKRERGQDYLTYQFKPAKTDIYLINLYQKKGVRDMCGYFAVMFKTNGIIQKQQPQMAQQPQPAYTPPANNNNNNYYRQPTNNASTTTRIYTAPQQQNYNHPQYNNNNTNQRNPSQAGTYMPPPPTKSVWQQTQEEKQNSKKQPLKKFSEEPPTPIVADEDAPKQEAIYRQPPPIKYNDANERTTYKKTKTVQEEVIYTSPAPNTTQPKQPAATTEPIRYQRSTTVTNSSRERSNYQSSKQQREEAQRRYQQQETETKKAPADPRYPDMPANQRPNPNRTRATREAMEHK